MNNLMSYIKWRGDIGLLERPFNEVDNLIFSELSYIDFTGIVPVAGNVGNISLKDAAGIMFSGGIGKDRFRVKGLSAIGPSFLKSAADSRRFGYSKLSNYIDLYDEDLQIQFAALTFELDDGTFYVGFRGTDQTILGWRENFTMSFQIVPAQKEATQYLERILADTDRYYRIGGHSKGGNLAVYASMMCNDGLKHQILEIYCNDSPGFSKELIQIDQYTNIRDRIIRIIPEFSIIGMLFEQDAPYRIVQSSASGLMQHDAVSWVVEGDHFITVDKLASDAEKINHIFDVWIEDVDMDHRRIFTDNFFDAIQAGGAKQICDIHSGGINGFESILFSIIGCQKEAKTVAGKLGKSVFHRLRQIDYAQFFKSKNVIRGICLALFGLLFMKVPSHSLQILGLAAVILIICFSTNRLLFHAIKNRCSDKVKKYRTIFYLAMIILALILIVNSSTLIFSSNIGLGMTLIAYGIAMLKETMKPSGARQKAGWLFRMLALISIMLGIIALVVTGRIMAEYVFVVGTFMIIAGFSEVIDTMYKMSINR